MVKNLPANARDMDLMLEGKIPSAIRATELQSTTTEALALAPMLLQTSPCYYHKEKFAHHWEEEPHLATSKESLCAATKTQCCQKNELIKNLYKRKKKVKGYNKGIGRFSRKNLTFV